MAVITYYLGKVGLTPKGAYDGGVTYEHLDVVTYAGGSYVSLANDNTAPPSDDTAWQPMAEQGDPGDKGDDGKGWTGGSYDDDTGIVTFTSTDGLGFATDDLRGKDGISPSLSPIAAYTETLVELPDHTSNVTIDLDEGNVFYLFLDGYVTLTIINAQAGAHSFTFILQTHGSIYPDFFEWPLSVKWRDGAVPVLQSAHTYVFTFLTIDEGVTWLGMLGGEF